MPDAVSTAVRDHARAADTIDLLFRQVYSIGKLWEKRLSPAPMRIWFRGVDDIAYPLDPSLLRAPYIDFEEPKRPEYEIGCDFRIRGRPYLKTDPRNSWDELFLMQHYGFPTRLLDWTESLAAAAYFAARDITSSSDGAVWVLSPQWLIRNAHGDGQGTHLHSSHPWLEPYKMCTGARRDDIDQFNKMLPLPVIPDHIDARIIAQRGRFTIHTFKPGALEALGAEDRAVHGGACFLHQIRIPMAAKPVIRQHAGIFGAAYEDTLFPDLEGLARSLRWETIEKEAKRS